MWEFLLVMVGGFAVGAMLLHNSRSEECQKALGDLKKATDDVAALTGRIVNLEAAAEMWTKNEKRNGKTA